MIVKLLFCVLFSLLYHHENHKTPNEYNTLIKVILKEKLDNEEYKNLKGIFYSVEIEILNNNDTSLHYWTMTCAWQNNWISTSDSLRLFNRGCPKNIPIEYEIKPKVKEVYKGIIQVKGPINDMKEKTFRLGLVLLNKFEFHELYSYENSLKNNISEQLKGKVIIWSEPFKID